MESLKKKFTCSSQKVLKKKRKKKKELGLQVDKSLCSLKQALRSWYKRFDSYIMRLEYNRLNSDPCAYFKRFGDEDFIILLLYVDDMLVRPQQRSSPRVKGIVSYGI